MDSGIGIGGLSVGKDEYATDCFNLFKSIEIENSIEDVTRIITRLISAANSKGPFIFEILQILKNLQMPNHFVFMAGRE